MKEVTSSAFRRTYLAETEPVQVTAYGKPIGYWYPVGSQPDAEVATTEAVAPEYRFTIRPAHGPRPEMVGETKPLFDPVELRKQELGRSHEVGSRTFGPRRKTS